MSDGELWAGLSPEEKREERFKRWLSPPGVKFATPKAEKAYKERVTRLIDVIKLKEPDRVPVNLPSGFFPIYYAGSTLQKVMYDYDELLRCWRKYISEFDMDTYSGPRIVFPGAVVERINSRLYNWPGHGLTSDAPMHQFLESEYMKAEEYDEFMENPSEFWMRVFLPRTAGAFEPFNKLPAFSPSLGVPLGYLISVGNPEVQAAFQVMLEAGRESARWSETVNGFNREALAAGFPSLRDGAMSGAPFDMIGNALRGMRGIITDMYRRPDKLVKALEKITPMAIKTAVSAAKNSECPVVYMPLHKGVDSFMSTKQFQTFYWPTLKQVISGLTDEGLVPMLFAEGSYNTRLEIIKNLPEASVIWYFENTDMAIAKQVLGKTACIAGNVPTSLICTSNPDEVKEYCRKLIQVAGKGGGFILAGGGIVHQCNADNLRAMMEACLSVRYLQ